MEYAMITDTKEYANLKDFEIPKDAETISAEMEVTYTYGNAYDDEDFDVCVGYEQCFAKLIGKDFWKVGVSTSDGYDGEDYEYECNTEELTNYLRRFNNKTVVEISYSWIN